MHLLEGDRPEEAVLGATKAASRQQTNNCFICFLGAAIGDNHLIEIR